MKKLYFILFIFPSLLFSQIPDITGTAIDTSNYSFIRSQIKMVSLFIENNSTNGERFFNRANLYREIGEYEFALEDFNKSAKLLPDELAIYYYRGSVYDNLKEYHKAILDYNKVIELNPEFEWGYMDRGMMFLETKDYAKSEKDFRKALALKQNWTMDNTLLSVKDFEKSNISSPFPNPTTGDINFNLGHLTGKIHVSIYTLSGRKLFETNVTNPNGIYTLSLAPQWKGTLLVTFEGDFGVANKKIIKL